ncbi:LOW QUALITY PROTEIN: protein NDNF [Aplochiton taeniatus]
MAWWCVYFVVALLWGPSWPLALSQLAPENEVPLRPTAWLPEGRVTPVRLPRGRTRRLYFTLKKASEGMAVTVSPCDQPVEWSLAARALKDKLHKTTHWSTKKSMPEVWWRGPGTETKLYSHTGTSMDTYTGPSYQPASIYILRLHSKQQDSEATVYLHQGLGLSGAFPVLPPDHRVHTLGVGMTSVTLHWSPSPSLDRLSPGQRGYEYCVLVNPTHNYPSLCSATKGLRRERAKEEKRKRREKERKRTPVTAAAADLECVCRGTESVCTVSELLPDSRYYFDVFLVDRLNGTSAAYAGTLGHTHEEAGPVATALREGELRWVTLRAAGGRRSSAGESFSFRPRGWQQSGLLTLQSCGGGQEVKVTVTTSRGQTLTSQALGEELSQIWLQGAPSYLIHLERGGGAENGLAPALPGGLRASVKMQTSSAYHRRGLPSLPPTLQIKSFSRLRGCHAVTLAWMGTEERSLYCVYRRRLPAGEGPPGGGRGGGESVAAAPCLGPESRSDTERVLCKYFQELNPRRAVTTATIGGLEPGTAYLFDVYLMRRWGIPVKYVSKTLRTRREC